MPFDCEYYRIMLCESSEPYAMVDIPVQVPALN